MGKFRSKLKGQTKGKRWPKGQSSSSNPITRKHRDAAKSRFFHASPETSNLTAEALKKHDAIHAYKSMQTPSTIGDRTECSESVATGTSYRSVETFASDWSECTNRSYNRLMTLFRPDSLMHKEMLAILAAITEVIKQNGGSESNTEYYGALMSTLEVAETEQSVAAILSLLSMGIRNLPDPVLRTHFSKALALYLNVLEKYSESNNNVIYRSVLILISEFLKKQEMSSWKNQETVKYFETLLAFTIHSKPKIRKAAQHGVSSVLNNTSNDDSKIHPASSVAAKFCQDQIDNASGSGGHTTTLHILGMLKDIVHTFPKNQKKSSCENILKIMTLNDPFITSCGLQVLHSLFSRQTVAMPAKMNGQLITALYDYQPSPMDVQPTLAWLAVMQQAHVHFTDCDEDLACNSLPKFVTTLVQLWLSEKLEVIQGSTKSLQTILEDCFEPISYREEAALQKHLPNLEKCFQTIQLALGYQYNQAWQQVLHIIAVVFRVAGRTRCDSLMGILKSLSELRDTYKFSYNDELDFAVGSAVKHMGPDVVLSVIPLLANEEEINIDRSWLLPVLKENIQNSSLKYFSDHILRLAVMCSRKCAVMRKVGGNTAKAHSYELLQEQLWNLLPSFCNMPVDIKQNFKSLAKILGTAISERKELRLSVMASLRKLILFCVTENKVEDLEELARFSKNYLPILFNLYSRPTKGTDEEGHRLAALDTINVYLTIAPADLVQSLFDNAVSRLESESEADKFVKESLMDLIRSMIRYQNADRIKAVYRRCIQPITACKDKKEQKKAYRLLEEICSNDSAGCQEFLASNRKHIHKILIKSLNSAAISSKGSRLRCMNYLIKGMPELNHESNLVKTAIGEAVVCCRDINERCRSAAFDLINTIGQNLEKRNEMPGFVAITLAGLAGTPQLMSCSILALASILYNFSGSLGSDNIQLILSNVCKLATTATREIVGSSLSFIKVYQTSLPMPVVGAALPEIIKTLCEMTEDCKRHFRCKVRDIMDRFVRKFGYETVVARVPKTDTVMLKRIKNLKKINAHKKKVRQAAREERDAGDNETEAEFALPAKQKSIDEILADSDSDDDDDDRVSEAQKKKKINTYIREDIDNIVDFTDPSAAKKITTSLPTAPSASVKEEQKDRGFKTAPDGRLIISMEKDEFDGSNKQEINFNSDSDSDDGKSAAETLVLGSRKRKRDDASSVWSGKSSRPAMKYKAGGSGIHRPVASTKASSVYTAGSEYRSKKAQGDIKKKGKPDPYAYVPLSRKFLNKRKRAKGAGQFKSIVRGAKKGAKKGALANKKIQKGKGKGRQGRH